MSQIVSNRIEFLSLLINPQKRFENNKQIKGMFYSQSCSAIAEHVIMFVEKPTQNS